MATKKSELARAARGEGPLGRAAADEPVFVLRARDALAPDLVELWAARAHLVGSPDEKVTEANHLAQAMREWAASAGGHKVPD